MIEGAFCANWIAFFSYSCMARGNKKCYNENNSRGLHWNLVMPFYNRKKVIKKQKKMNQNFCNITQTRHDKTKWKLTSLEFSTSRVVRYLKEIKAAVTEMIFVIKTEIAPRMINSRVIHHGLSGILLELYRFFPKVWQTGAQTALLISLYCFMTNRNALFVGFSSFKFWWFWSLRKLMRVNISIFSLDNMKSWRWSSLVC